MWTNLRSNEAWDRFDQVHFDHLDTLDAQFELGGVSLDDDAGVGVVDESLDTIREQLAGDTDNASTPMQEYGGGISISLKRFVSLFNLEQRS